MPYIELGGQLLQQTAHVDVSETFTTVILRGDRFAAVGTAKRNPRDGHDAQVGVDLATARALRELAGQLEANAVAKF